MKAIILLYEIYGKNHFIREQCEKIRSFGYDVYCPDFYNGNVFEYEDTDAAYHYFCTHVGFDRYHSVLELVDELKLKYEAVYIMGYSVGATLAWRCSENPNCSGVIACYGSRIRDYLSVRPKCPSLLLFAEKDSFDVASVMAALKGIPLIDIKSFPAEHGFMDSYSSHYSALWAEEAEDKIMNFLKKQNKTG